MSTLYRLRLRIGKNLLREAQIIHEIREETRIKIFVLFAEYIFKNSPNSFHVIIVKHKDFMTVDC